MAYSIFLVIPLQSKGKSRIPSHTILILRTYTHTHSYMGIFTQLAKANARENYSIAPLAMYWHFNLFAANVLNEKYSRQWKCKKGRCTQSAFIEIVRYEYMYLYRYLCGSVCVYPLCI